MGESVQSLVATLKDPAVKRDIRCQCLDQCTNILLQSINVSTSKQTIPTVIEEALSWLVNQQNGMLPWQLEEKLIETCIRLLERDNTEVPYSFRVFILSRIHEGQTEKARQKSLVHTLNISSVEKLNYILDVISDLRSSQATIHVLDAIIGLGTLMDNDLEMLSLMKQQTEKLFDGMVYQKREENLGAKHCTCIGLLGKVANVNLCVRKVGSDSFAQGEDCELIGLFLNGFVQNNTDVVADAAFLEPLYKHISSDGTKEKQTLAQWLNVSEGGEFKSKLDEACSIYSKRTETSLEVLCTLLQCTKIAHVLSKSQEFELVSSLFGCLGCGGLPDRLPLPWANEKVQALSLRALELLKHQGKPCHESDKKLPVKTGEKIIVETFATNHYMVWLRSQLKGDSWKTSGWHLSACFVYVVNSLSGYTLTGDLIGEVIPVILPFIEHYDPRISTVGLQMLTHLIEELTPTEVRWYAAIIFDSLGQAMTSRDIAVLKAALLAYTEALAKAESVNREIGPGSQHDEFLLKIIVTASYVTNGLLLVEYLKAIQTTVERMGIHAVRHWMKIFPLLKSSIPSQQSRTAGLCLTLTVVRNFWPRVQCHKEGILALVLRSYILLESSASENRLDTTQELLIGYLMDILEAICGPEWIQEKIQFVETETERVLSEKLTNLKLMAKKDLRSVKEVVNLTTIRS